MSSGLHIYVKDKGATTHKVYMARGEAICSQIEAASRQPHRAEVGYLDRGASVHMSFDKIAFRTITLLIRRITVEVGNSELIDAIAIGTVPLEIPTGGGIVLTDVLLVPKLVANLISNMEIMQNGGTIHC